MSPVLPIPWDVYEEHLDEAAFLWGQRERAMDAANYTLDEVIEGPEERLLAHLDGLVLGGLPVANRLLIPALADEDLDKVSAASWALLQAEDADHLDLVVEALVKADTAPVRRALGRAFELSEREDLAVRLLPLMLKQSAPGVQAVIVSVVSSRGSPPGAGKGKGKAPSAELLLPQLLATPDPELLVAALRALRWAPDPALAEFVERPLRSPYVAIRDAAIETGMVLGMRAAWQACNKLVSRNATSAQLALAMLALGGEPVDLKAVIKRLKVETMRRDALWALGFGGTVEAAEAVLGLMDDEKLARLAGESFAAITGLSLVGAMVKIGQTDNTAAAGSGHGSEDGSEDDDLPLPMVHPEDDLPVPDAASVRAWWGREKAKFQPDVRYLYGQRVTPDVLHAASAVGPTWRRRIWSLESSIRGARGIDLNSWARTHTRALSTSPRAQRVEGMLSALARI